jgi:hypothetical protein
MKLTKQQQDEITRCAVDFPYFCKEYVKVLVPYGSSNTGIIPFELHPYQVRLYEHMEDNRFSIFSKFRQGGFTSEVAIYGLWKSLFRLDQSILWISKTDREAIEVSRIVKRAIEYMPDWMKGGVMKMSNDHEKSFTDTGSRMFFGAPQAARSKAATLLVIDEASFIKDMDQHWKAIYPVISTGGNCVVMSTVNQDTDWFWLTLEDAILDNNQFEVYRCHYKDRPEFCDPKWEAGMRNQLGSSGWETEMMQQPLVTVQAAANKKKSPGLWRSIWDDWESSNGDTGSEGTV